MELQDQRVLVTGATAGIGQEAAKLFARRRAAVVITGRDTQRGAQTVAAIEADGGHAEFIAADLNDIKSMQRLAEHAGDVDVLINNAAATRTRFAPTLEQDVESFDTIFEVNVRGPFFLTAALLPKMIARGSGAIVNISTMYASVGVADAPVVAAAKAALESFTRSWAAAFGANGIRVNTVAPGPTRTDGAVGALGDWLEQLGSATPLGRTADPTEIAEAIAFPASPQASYLTGTTVAVDGGFTGSDQTRIRQTWWASPASSPCSASTSSSRPRSGPPADSLARPTAARRWAKRVAPPRWPRRPVLKGLNVCDDRRDGRPDNQNPNPNRDGRGDQRHRVQFHFHDSPPQYGSWPYSGQYNPTAASTSAAIAAA